MYLGNAKSRIVWSSLYLGNGRLEQTLVDKLRTQLHNNDEVKFKGIFDYTRSLRGERNTLHMFNRVTEDFQGRFVAVFR